MRKGEEIMIRKERKGKEKRKERGEGKGKDKKVPVLHTI